MELIFENIDLILTAAIIIISAVVFARRGQIQLIRELILSLCDGITAEEIYERLPKLTRLMISTKTLTKLTEEKSAD